MVKAPTRGDAAGRNIGARLKTADVRTMSSQLWLNRQINDRFHVIRRGCRIIDLGCAPGGWVQVALERGAGTVVGIDLLPVDPLPPAILIEGDFTADDAPAQLTAALGGPPDLLLSDMAPNTIGHPQTDHLRIVGLVELAAAFAVDILPPGGAFVTKAFQGGETADLLKLLKANFTDVKHFKPKSSRAESSELYLVATGRR
jgi:23S rRNA (uridine2552-2'-O)-methyltransferase